MATIANLIVNVAADTAELKRGVSDVQKTLGGFEQTIGKFGKILAGAFTVTAVVGFIKELGRFAGEMKDISDQTGIGIRKIQALNYAAVGAGASIEQVATAISMMSKNLTSGNDGAIAALDRLGLSASALQRMEPDQAFIEIGEAIKALPNPMDQARAAMEIFGKTGAKLLPLLKSDIAAVTEEAERNGAVISAALIEKADALDDKWNQLIIRGKALAATILGIGAAVVSVATSTDKVVGGGMTFANAKVGGGGPTPAEEAADVERALRGQLDAMKKLRGPVQDVGLGYQSLSAEWALEAGLLENQSRKLLENIKANEEAAQKQQAWIATTTEMNHGLQMNLTRWAVLPPAIRDAREEIERIRQTIAGATQNLGAMNLMMQATAVVPTQFMGKGNVSSAAVRTGASLGGALRSSFAGALDAMPSVILGALQGGGSLGRSIGSLFGGGIGSALSGGISKALGGSIGKMAGSIMGPLGSIAGSFIGKGMSALFGKLFGGGEKKKVQEALGKFADQFGGLEGLKAAAREAGVSLDKLFSAKKVKEFEAEQRKVIAGLDRYKQKMDALNQLADAQAKRQQMLNDAVQRYGFTIEELGPKMRAQKLAEQAEELITDFTLLTGSGIDVDLVIKKMADSINKFVGQAIRTGTEIPISMRPMLEHMVRMGLLTDENGRKLESLEGLTFGTALEEMFEGVLEKLDDLIEKLTEIIESSNRIPANPFSGWTVPSPPIPDGAPIDQQGFTHGTGGRFLDFGRGTRVTLHGRERVVTEAEGRSDARGMGAIVRELRGLRATVATMGELIPIAARDAAVLARAR